MHNVILRNDYVSEINFLCVLQCFDTLGCVAGRASGL